jgi:hypothetical protein
VSCEDLIACPAAKSPGILSVEAIGFALRKRLNQDTLSKRMGGG